MRRIAQVVSYLALAATLLPPMLFLADRMSLATVKVCMLAAAAVWFIATPLWMEHKTTQ